MKRKERLDVLLVRRGLFDSRERAQSAILAGRVFVGEQRVDKPGARLPEDASLSVRGEEMPYVSRGGVKLARGLDAFGINPAGWVALDVGASTGGFTDVLLQRGAARVIAVDVGYGQFAWKLRADPRVLLLERTNIRHLLPQQLPERPRLAVIDVSFISLEKVLPSVRALLQPGGEVVALVKPQFEAGPEKVGKGGIVRDTAVHREVLSRVCACAAELGYRVAGIIPSPIPGTEGNREFLLHLVPGSGPPPDIDAVVR
jgi:23S rRNA (cytidine1920-2'-O)/16S rRNA (cytidine1409-2'-O)-methyltransferase